MNHRNLWTSGDAYERYMGRWSREVGRRFTRWLHADDRSSWLDVGCGTGALTETILSQENPSQVVGIDPSTSFIEYARGRIEDPRATFEAGNAQSLPPRLRGFDLVVSGLLLNFLPDQDLALNEMVKAVKPAGTVAAYVWDYAEGMQPMRRFWEVACTLDPDAKEFDEGRRESICNPQALADHFESRLSNVEVTSIVIATDFKDFDDYWEPFLGGVGSAPGYVTSLDPERRERLSATLKASLLPDANGAIRLTARAWAVKGTNTVN